MSPATIVRNRRRSAKELAEEGFGIIHVPAGQKAPDGEGWQNRAATTKDGIDALIQTADDQYGVYPLPGTRNFALDVDRMAAIGLLGDLPETFTVLSSMDTKAGERKRHLYLRAPDGFDMATLPKTLYTGEFEPHSSRPDLMVPVKLGEVRHSGSGHVVGPDSVHPSGSTYDAMNDAPTAEAPLALLQRMQELGRRPAQGRTLSASAQGDLPARADGHERGWTPTPADPLLWESELFASLASAWSKMPASSDADELAGVAIGWLRDGSILDDEGTGGYRQHGRWEPRDVIAKAHSVAQKYEPGTAVGREGVLLNVKAADAPAAAAPPTKQASDDDLLAGFVNIEDYRASVPTNIPWVIKPYVCRGMVTLVTGSPKAGKSTLCAQWQRARETGEEFLGELVTMGPTLLVTEESGVAVVYKTAGLEALTVYDRAASKGEPFETLLLRVEAWLRQNPRGLVFVDTLAVWAGVDDENSSSEMTKALDRLNLIAAAHDAPIVVIHHARKGGGANGEAIRGSGAILATVGISVEMKRVTATSDDDRRWLDISGRVLFPDRITTDFDRDSLTYFAIEDVMTEEASAEAARWQQGMEFDLGKPGQNAKQLEVMWGVKPRRRIDRLTKLGLIHRVERKVPRGKEFVYWGVRQASEEG